MFSRQLFAEKCHTASCRLLFLAAEADGFSARPMPVWSAPHSANGRRGLGRISLQAVRRHMRD